MNTYRVYILNTRSEDAPEITRVFHRAEKYKDAWETARAMLNGEDTKRHFFSDPACVARANTGHGVNFTCAKVTEVKTRNAKLDKASIGEIMADKSLSDQDKIAKIAELAK